MIKLNFEILIILFLPLITVDCHRGGGWNNGGGHGHGHGHNWKQQHHGQGHGNNNWNRHQHQQHFQQPVKYTTNGHSPHNTFGQYDNSQYNSNLYQQPYSNYNHEKNSASYPSYLSNTNTEPAADPKGNSSAVKFTHTATGSECPRPVMGDQSKFELSCILPDEYEDKDCLTLDQLLASGTTVILRCKPPYINENGEIRIWVCENGSWKGEFKSITCIQGGYAFNFKNQTNNTNVEHPTTTVKKPISSYHKKNNSSNSWTQPPPSNSEKKKSPVLNKPSPSQPSNSNNNKVVNNLFPDLLTDEDLPDTNLPASFPAWRESIPASPQLQHPWQNTFDQWAQNPYPFTTTTTMAPTTTTRQTTTTTLRPTTTVAYGWMLPKKSPSTTTTPRSKVVKETSGTLPYQDWNSNQSSIKMNKCPSLRRRTGVQLDCLSKVPVSSDDSSFLVTQSDCKSPQRVGTEATYKCQQYYESSAGLTLQYRKCKEDGTWTGGDNGFSCALECGKSNPVGRLPLITNGEATYKAQWPWHAALFFQNTREIPSQFEYTCGGSLISKRAILTAAHCVTEFFSTRVKTLNAFRIDLGRYERTREDEFVQTFSVDYIIPHPSYNPHSFDSDIAIIVLDAEVTIGFNVRPICYPQTQNSAFEALHLSDGSIGTVVGFGKNEQNELSDLLHMARLKVVSQQECAASFTDTSYGTSLTKSTTFCAGLRNGTNVCQGDSGGGIYFPLNTAGESRWYLQGLVSVGISSEDGSSRCDPTRFSIFTRISPYADWIVRVLSEKEAL